MDTIAKVWPKKTERSGVVRPFTKTEQTKQRIAGRKLMAIRLDRAAGEFVKRRAMKLHKGCQCCALMNIPGVTRMVVIRRWQDLDWAHFKSAGKHSVRWDEANATGLCRYCHRFLDEHKEIKEEFFRKLMGDEEIDELIRRAETVKLSAEIDYPVLELYLKGKVKELRDY